jgi:hypothetical protein
LTRAQVRLRVLARCSENPLKIGGLKVNLFGVFKIAFLCSETSRLMAVLLWPPSMGGAHGEATTYANRIIEELKEGGHDPQYLTPDVKDEGRKTILSIPFKDSRHTI